MLDAVARGAGRGGTSSSERVKSGLAKPPTAQRAQVGDNGVEVVGLMGEVRRQRGDRRAPSRPRERRRGLVVRRGRPSRRAAAAGEARRSPSFSCVPVPGRRPPARRPRRGGAAKRGLGGPVDEVQPQLAWSSSPRQSSPNRSESAATTTRPGAVLGDAASSAAPGADDGAEARASTRAPLLGLERRRAVEAGLVDAREQVDAAGAAVAEVGQHPVRRALVVVLVVGDRLVRRSRCRSAPRGRRGCCRTCPAPPRRAAPGRRRARRTPRSRRALRRRRRGEPPGTVALPLRLARVRDDEHVGAGKRGRGQRADRCASTAKSRARSGAGGRARRRSPPGATAGSRPRDVAGGSSRPRRGTRRTGRGRRVASRHSKR